jgi:adenosylcobinamide-GDP ribazoletransferase
MRLICAFFMCLGMFTSIPCPYRPWDEDARDWMLVMLPMVGLVVGLLWVILGLLGWGLFPAVGGAWVAALPWLLTGFIHLDGYMDTCDAMLSWRPLEKRLEILKDSHTGAFAVIGCCAYLLASAGLYSELNLIWPMLCVFVISRSLSAFALNHLPKANPGGMLSGFADAAKKRAVDIACSIYLLICAAGLIILWKWIGLATIAAAGICLLYYRHFAMKHFGGVTGDLAGWFVQVTELACLAVLILGGKL